MPPIALPLVLRHERLHPRLTHLLGPVEKWSARHPEAPLPPELDLLCGLLLRETRQLLGPLAGPRPRSRTPSLALLAALGQALAALEGFEAEWCEISDGRLCWALADGSFRPVARHRGKPLPRGAAPPAPAAAKGEAPELRTKLARRIDRIRTDSYDRGYRDALAGKPRQTDLSSPSKT